jgi:hypothetical protein
MQVMSRKSVPLSDDFVMGAREPWTESVSTRLAGAHFQLGGHQMVFQIGGHVNGWLSEGGRHDAYGASVCPTPPSSHAASASKASGSLVDHGVTRAKLSRGSRRS